MTFTLDDHIRQLTRAALDAESAIIEADLARILSMSRASLLPEQIKPLGLEVAFHRGHTSAFESEYRGIRRNGEWLIDHHPEWGPVHE